MSVIPGTKQTIFIIEDDEDLCSIIEELLLGSGYCPTKSAGQRDATHKLRNQRYDAILLDMHLAEGNGEELVSFIRRKDSLNFKTPIVVISGHLDRKLVEKIAPSIQGALVKPFDMLSLLGSIKKLTGSPIA